MKRSMGFASVCFGRSSCLLLLAAFVGLVKDVSGQDRTFEESFLSPPEIVESILTRDAHYDTLNAFSPDRRHFVIPIERKFSNFELMSLPTYRLAMLEFLPEANREWRLSTYGVTGLKIYSLKDRASRAVQLPPEVFVSDLVWSPDGRQLAFLVHLRQGSQVWKADVSTGEARAVSDRFVMATLAARPQWRRSATAPSRMLQWTPQGDLLTLLVPENRGPEPQKKKIPASPVIRKTREKATPTRTYPFLLRTPRDQQLFRYYTTAQLALLSEEKEPVMIGRPAMYLEFSLSPDGRYILSERLEEPFSYVTSFQSFPRKLEVLDLEGNVLSTIRSVPLDEVLRRQGEKGPEADLPREVAWRPDGKGLSILWKEEKKQPEEGEAKENESEDEPRNDRLLQLEAPFDLNRVRLLAESKKSFSDVVYSSQGEFAFARLKGKGDGTRNLLDIVALDLQVEQPEMKFLVQGVDPKDPLHDPGEIVTSKTGNGISFALMSSDKSSVYLQGEGYREELVHRPFIDRVQIATGEKDRLFESSAESYEKPLAYLDGDLQSMIISRESAADFPDSYLRREDGSSVRLTDNRNPFPEVEAVKRIDFEFTRRDGLTIQARLSLPVDYQEGSRVPAVFWTYPREYESFQEYHRAAIRSRNKNAFPQLDYRNASDIWLTQGYAVVDPDIPIIGKGNQFNDNYIAHLVDSMYAAIRKLDQMGYVDVDRLGHGGHSYGAFATANILARTPFFKAGIAGDGAYNRTLTPMSFQSEKRFLWQTPATYLEMSPFFEADHLDTPLLMYHGAADNNTGTFLIQSERMLQALTGLGKTAVLYIYPFESHGPRSIETYQDLWSRWLTWFDQYVKNAGQKGEPSQEVSETEKESRNRR